MNPKPYTCVKCQDSKEYTFTEFVEHIKIVHDYDYTEELE